MVCHGLSWFIQQQWNQDHGLDHPTDRRFFNPQGSMVIVGARRVIYIYYILYILYIYILYIYIYIIIYILLLLYIINTYTHDY